MMPDCIWIVAPKVGEVLDAHRRIPHPVQRCSLLGCQMAWGGREAGGPHQGLDRPHREAAAAGQAAQRRQGSLFGTILVGGEDRKKALGRMPESVLPSKVNLDGLGVG